MGQPVPGNRQAIMASSHRWKSSGAPQRKTSPRGRTSSHTTETMPGGGPQTDTIAITQGHLPYNAESPPAAPIADYLLLPLGLMHAANERI
jgi:hypothetical protein